MKDLLPLIYFKDYVKLADQRKLPKLKYIYCHSEKDIFSAIRKMKIRGAPAIGIAGAFGLYLGVKDIKIEDKKVFFKKLNSIAKFLISSRPTAVNLYWAISRIVAKATENRYMLVDKLKKLIYQEAVAIMKDDQARSRKMGEFGSSLIKNGENCLTICNAGGMATSGYGTALSVFFRAKEKDKKFKVYACETRPLLQGARITTWELTQMKIKTTLICDNMAASLMKKGIIQRIFVGADRVTMSGDFANKIGTYNLAVLAHYHKVPFYVVAPLSTFDKKLYSGKDIPIEYRDKEEVRSLYFKKPIAPIAVDVYNPSFDVTDAKFVTAFITEKGMINPPYKYNIKKIANEK